MPIWIALFQSIIRVLAVVPEDFLNLSQRLYTSWPSVFSLVPLGSDFLWLDLAIPDRFLFLPILVGGTMWLQQKMVTPVSADPRQATQGRMMLWMMPIMFAFLTLQFPSGLALYWIVSNIFTIVIQYRATGWGGLVSATAQKPDGRDKKYVKRITQVEEKPVDYTDVGADITDAEVAQKESSARGGYPASIKVIRRQPKSGKGHRHKRR
jgi:YidC/Oxa1 family membrane protein insertase